jgi:hypothetical protein
MKEQRLRRIVFTKPLWYWLLLLLPLAIAGATATAAATRRLKRTSLCCRPATVLRGGTSNSPTMYYESPPSSAFQNRIDQWRSVQQVEQSERNAELATVAPGRQELAPTAGWYITFILIIVRSGYLLVLARDEEQNLGDHDFSFLFCLPLLIIANLFGVVIVALLGPSLTPTRMFKGVLNLEKDVNLLWIVYSIFRLTVFPTRLRTRETHIWNVVAAAFFLWQATRWPSRFYHDTGRVMKEHGLLRIVLHRLLELSMLFLATAVAANRVSTWVGKQRCCCWCY